MGFAGGVTPLIGALYGARKFDEAGGMLRVAMRQNLIVGAMVVLVMSALYFALPYMGQPPELLPLIKDYYLICRRLRRTGAGTQRSRNQHSCGKNPEYCGDGVDSGRHTPLPPLSGRLA